MRTLNVALIQMNSGANVKANLAIIEHLISTKLKKNTDIILLPEYFAMLGPSQMELAYYSIKVREWMASIAHQQNSWLIGGSLPILDKNRGKNHASCFVYDSLGNEVSFYNKMHLFDAEVADNKRCYRESDYLIPGDKGTVVNIGFAKVGLSICYDLRFPELYRHLVQEGANILCIPSAFTRVTGEQHWEILLKARAIENQCFVLASNQSGKHPDGFETWGHSMIISPSGEVIANAGNKNTTLIQAELDINELKRIRKKMPCLNHQRFFSRYKTHK